MKAARKWACWLSLIALLAGALAFGLAPLGAPVGAPLGGTGTAMAASSGDGRIDMVDLLNLVLGIDKIVDRVTITSPEGPGLVKVLEGSRSLPLTIEADVAPRDAAGEVVFGLDGAREEGGVHWSGGILSHLAEVGPPLVATLDLAELDPAERAGVHWVYALTPADATAMGDVFDIQDAREITIEEIPSAGFDDNGDGIPDDLFHPNFLGEGDVYVGTVAGVGGYRTKIVVVADLARSNRGATVPGKNPVTVSIPTDGPTVTVQAPNLADLVAATPDLDEGERAVLVVQVAPDLATLLDSGAVPRQSRHAAAFPKGVTGLAFGAPYVHIAIVCTKDGGLGLATEQLTELADPLSVKVSISDLTIGPASTEGAGIWGHTSNIGGTNNTVVTIPSDGRWVKRPGSTLDRFRSGLEIRLTDLSILAVLDTQFEATRVSPDQGRAEGGNVVNIQFSPGTFPIEANLQSVAAATAAYSVYFGERLTDDGLADFEVGQISPIITNQWMYVRVPPMVDARVPNVNVWVVDNASPSDFSTLVGAYTYQVELPPAEAP